MTTTTTEAPEAASTGVARTAPPRSVDQVTATPDADSRSESRREPSYTLLSPPNYDNIVGGVAPSPFVSALLLGGFVALIVAVIGTGTGHDMTQLWILGAILVVIATFLAGFVSRSA